MGIAEEVVGRGVVKEGVEQKVGWVDLVVAVVTEGGRCRTRDVMFQPRFDNFLARKGTL